MTAEFVAGSPAIPPEGRVSFEVGSRVRFLAPMPWAGVEIGDTGVVSDIWRGDDTIYRVRTKDLTVVVDDYDLWMMEPQL